MYITENGLFDRWQVVMGDGGVEWDDSLSLRNGRSWLRTKLKAVLHFSIDDMITRATPTSDGSQPGKYLNKGKRVT